jgi:hypothetical protein
MSILSSGTVASWLELHTINLEINIFDFKGDGFLLSDPACLNLSQLQTYLAECCCSRIVSSTAETSPAAPSGCNLEGYVQLSKLSACNLRSVLHSPVWTS